MAQVGIPSVLQYYFGAFWDIEAGHQVIVGPNVAIEGGYVSVQQDWVTEAGWHGFTDETVIANTGGHGYASYDCLAKESGPGPYNHFVGYQARQEYNSAGNCVGYFSSFDMIPEHNGAGTIANVHGVHVRDIAGVGPVTADYGVYVDNIARGATNWAIYTAGASFSFFNAGIKLGAGGLVGRATADGADNSYISLSGGGAEGVTRGGAVNLFGNEHALKGSIAMLCGLGGGAGNYGDWILYHPSGPTECLRYSMNRNVLSFTILPPAYGNNAAAQAGGLSVGDLYRTGGDPSYLAVRSV